MVKIDISAYFSCSIKIALSHNSYPLLKIRVKFAYKSQETMRITKENTSTVIIDIQERLFPHMYNREELEHNVQILMKGLKLLNIPILITEQYSKGLGKTIPTISENKGNIEPIEKISFSCCDESRFLKELNMLNKKFVILAGIETHVCVLQTVLDLIDSGFNPVLVEDCVSSRKKNDKKIAVERIRSEGGIITTYESILLELCRVAGTETFKQISGLIK
jgi:nicotinamidase-related amidase